MSTQEYTAEQLQEQGYIRETCRNCNGKGMRVPPLNPDKGEIPCKQCGQSGQVWVDPSRIKTGGPIGSIRHLIARDITGVS